MPNQKEINKFLEDVKEAFEKAIGTSSSVNEERDERSVENYVRTGGNTMENTTEPDPKGDIAVTKVINGETAPAGNQSVSDAPEGPTPTEETFVSSATSAVAPSRSDEMNQPVKVTKSTTCSDCGGSIVHECMGKADDSAEESKVEKAADFDEVTETVEKAADVESKEEDAKETPADEKAEVKKSIWGGAFAPRK